MTFGTEWGWGSDETVAGTILDAYLDAGGNFIDTADIYTEGTSELMLGRLLKGRRDRAVLATKYTFNFAGNDPNAGGNHRKHLLRSVEASLRRLGTDHIDLYWLHCWDGVTAAEEVMATVDALVRAGKILHFGLSDTPAWYAAQADTLARLRGWERVCALQLEYSLVERSIESEHIPMARSLGLAVCPWSPLAGGFLTGKYQRRDTGATGDGRLRKMEDSPLFNRFTDRNWRILAELEGVATELGRPPAQVALAWVARRPGVVSTIIGASTPQQLATNLAAMELEIPAPMIARLEAASRPEARFPYNFFTAERCRGSMHGGNHVTAAPAWYNPGS